ncbi:J domain-containing protein [Mycena indigotica]|uniref:J domain-containing protein n=1 Tax=Mycena indigotica TaxID=2126181 RepID=A0A8H6SXP1_9AGAR|nr:J domain-containing protein [Mycena indigotica]KAF7307193.1 J domain-containing protein [Mycena indigotica]
MSREASRPRPSVLLLFDPLANDNDDHELNFDSFLQPPRNPSPVRLTRRLVDVGDVTVQFDNSELLLEDEDECDEKPEEIERTPKAQQRQSTRPTEGTPRAIPSIHATLSTPPSTALQVSEDDPQVLASFATPSAFLATPCESLITDTVLALPTPSPAAPGTTLVPPKQLDQHGSFALHDHNDLDEDTSFDLLNDKIPFLGHADEDSFELDGPPATIKSPIEVEEEEEPERVLPAAHPSVSSTITTNVIPELATPHCSPIPTFSAPPPLIPALKIVKRQRPEPKAPAATNPPKPPRDPSPVAAVFTRPPVFSAPPKVPPPIAPPAAVVPLSNSTRGRQIRVGWARATTRAKP